MFPAMRVLRRATLPLLCASTLIVLLGGCGVVVGHAIHRDTREDAMAVTAKVSPVEAERRIRAVLSPKGIEFSERDESGDEILLKGNDPGGVSVEVEICSLDRGFVRITASAGSTLDDILNEGINARVAAEVRMAIRAEFYNDG